MTSTRSGHSTRVQRPAGIIERPRLLHKLELALDHKLTLVSAPPGYGKTTLALQFSRRVGVPVAWHTVEERERDLPNLIAQCLSALEPVAPGAQKLALPGGIAAGEMAAFIANHLRDSVRGDYVYILDDAQHLAGSTLAEIWLQALVANLPRNCHLVLVSRMLPDLPLAEMIARREVLAIGQQDLRFTPDEIQLLASETLGTSLSQTEVQELVARLDGWPAGVVLALHPLPAELERAMLSGGAGPEALFDALAERVLAAQPASLRDFLLASSTLTRMTPELCAGALGLSNSAAMLSEMQGRNLFLGRGAQGLEYHRLFRSFLQRQIKRASPERFASLHLRAARWFEAHDDIDAAFDHYMDADQPSHAAVLAERAAQAYFALGRVETLLEWETDLNHAGVTVPGLLCVCAKIHTDRYQYAAAEASLSAAEARYEESGDKDGMADVQIQRAMISLQQGEYRKAVLRVTGVVNCPGIAPGLQGRALNILGSAQLRLGETEPAIQNLEAALPFYRAEGSAYALSQLLQNLEIAYTRAGRHDEAVKCLHEVIALRRLLRSPGPLAMALNNLGYYYHQHGNYREAMSTFQEGLSVASRAANRQAESYLLWSTGDLWRDRGAFDEARRLYDKALELVGSDEPHLRSAILVSAATMARWNGNLSDSIRLAEEAHTLACAHDIALERATARAAIWASRLNSARIARVRAALETVAADLGRQGTQIELMQVLGICAQAALLCGDQAGAEHHLDSALTLARGIGSVHPLACEVLRSEPLNALIAESPRRYDVLLRGLRLLREAQFHSPGRRSASRREGSVTYTLRVQTLGQEVIERDGERIPSTTWKATKAREMFLYMLFHPRITREQICLGLWPDSSTSRGRSSFHTTVYRIRRALGDNVISFDDGVYMLNPEVEVWCDATELERLAGQARLFPPRDPRTEDLWGRAVDLYQGDFLPSLDADWVYSRRDSLQETYLDALLGLGECMKARSDYRSAIVTYKRALTIDPYREDIHRAIMICYARLGEKKQIQTHMRELQELFLHELRLSPSAETVTLAANLLR